MKDQTASTSEQAKPDTEAHHELLRKLFREFTQTERSASRHARREAERYGSEAPAQALRAVAEHAERARREIADLARRCDLSGNTVGALVGESLSLVRELIVDQLVDAERSFRGTLVGIRQGTDLVDLIRRVADASGQVEIGGFCTRWLEERQPLVDQVARELGWFARHPRRAARIHRPRVLARFTGGARQRPSETIAAHSAS